MTALKIAFLGLGLMGSGMAWRLIDAGFSVQVYNRNPARSAALADQAVIAVSPRDAARDADIIMSMVADDQASRDMWLGEHGALSGAKPGATCLESSTLSVGWVKEWASIVEAAGCHALDTPVTGSKGHAAAGELVFLVGGAETTLEKARPALAAMSRDITHLGPIGSGAMFKLINNFVCGVQLASLAEAVVMIDRSGLDRDTAIEALAAGSPGSPLVKMVSARMAKGDYTPNFLIKLMAKDLTYATQEAETMALNLVTGKAGLETFNQAVAAGFGDDDIAAVYKYVSAT